MGVLDSHQLRATVSPRLWSAGVSRCGQITRLLMAVNMCVVCTCVKRSSVRLLLIGNGGMSALLGLKGQRYLGGWDVVGFPPSLVLQAVQGRQAGRQCCAFLLTLPATREPWGSPAGGAGRTGTPWRDVLTLRCLTLTCDGWPDWQGLKAVSCNLYVSFLHGTFLASQE